METNRMTALVRAERSTGSGYWGKPATALGERLRQLRLRERLTQAEMATRVGLCNAGRVSDWELGTRVPTLNTLARYAECFDCSVSELLRGVL